MSRAFLCGVWPKAAAAAVGLRIPGPRSAVQFCRMWSGDPSACMSTTRSDRRLPVIVETRSVSTITGCRRPREEPVALGAIGGLWP